MKYKMLLSALGLMAILSLGVAISAKADTSITPVAITSPAGDEQWPLGSIHAISWDPAPVAGGSVQISLIDANGVSDGFVMVPGSAGSYQWNVGMLKSPVAPGTYRISVAQDGGCTNSIPSHCSETLGTSNTFGITAPAGGPIIVPPPVVVPPPTSDQTLPAGLIFKYANNPTIYFVSVDCKRAYTSYQAFQSWTGTNQKVVVLADSIQVSSCAVPTIDYIRNNSIFRYAGSPGLYTLDNNEKQPITSMQVYQTLYRSSYPIATFPTGQTYPNGSNAFFGNGYVIKGSGPQVYLTSGNQLRPFSSLRALTDLGFTTQDILRVNDGDLTLEPVGAVMN